MPIDRLAAFYHKYYQPDNALLTVAGRFDTARALDLIAKSLGALPRPERKLEKTYTVEPTQDGEREVTLRRVGDSQAVMVVYHTPAATHPDSAALEVLATILGDTPSGRLHKALVESNKAVGTGADQFELHDPGFLMASVRLKQDQSLEEARTIALKTIAGVVAEPPSKEEVDRAKARILKQVDLDLNDSESIGVTISEYAASGDWRLLYLDRDRVKSVTPEDVARVAKTYLKDSNRTVGVFIPTRSPDRTEVPAGPDPEALLKDYKGGAPIAEGEVFSATAANVESRVVRSQLPNGARLVLLPKKTRGGSVHAEVRLEFGDEHALFGKAAAAQLTAAMLMRGSKSKTRQQIQDESDRLKARISVYGGGGSVTVNIETVEANLPGALRLVAEVFREPVFPESEFAQLKQERIAGVEANKSEPQFLGSVELQRLMHPYPRGDVRYTGTPDEQIEDLRKVTLDDVRKFLRPILRCVPCDPGHQRPVHSGRYAEAGGRPAGQLAKSRRVHASPHAVSENRRRRPQNRDCRQAECAVCGRHEHSDQGRRPRLRRHAGGQLHLRRLRRVATVQTHPRQGGSELRDRFQFLGSTQRGRRHLHRLCHQRSAEHSQSGCQFPRRAGAHRKGWLHS